MAVLGAKITLETCWSCVSVTAVRQSWTLRKSGALQNSYWTWSWTWSVLTWGGRVLDRLGLRRRTLPARGEESEAAPREPSADRSRRARHSKKRRPSDPSDTPDLSLFYSHRAHRVRTRSFAVADRLRDDQRLINEDRRQGHRSHNTTRPAYIFVRVLWRRTYFIYLFI